jgi:hypothetical protein
MDKGRKNEEERGEREEGGGGKRGRGGRRKEPYVVTSAVFVGATDCPRPKNSKRDSKIVFRKF